MRAIYYAKGNKIMVYRDIAVCDAGNQPYGPPTSYPCCPAIEHKWKDGQILEEGKEYFLTEESRYITCDAVFTMAYPPAPPLPKEDDQDELWKDIYQQASLQWEFGKSRWDQLKQQYIISKRK